MGTDAMPPLPPVNVNEMATGGGEINQSQKSSKKNTKRQMYDKIFGVTKKKKKKELEDAKNLLNFYDNFDKDLRKALKGLLVDDVSYLYL
jgi:hypothetical protein